MANDGLMWLPLLQVSAEDVPYSLGWLSGTADVSLPQFEVSAEALIGSNATATLPCLTVSGSFGLSTTVTLPSLETSGQGQVRYPITADIDLPLPEIDVRTGLRADIQLPLVDVSSTGIVPNVGTASVSIPNLEITATGTSPNVSSATILLPLLVTSAVAVIESAGSASVELPKITVDATGINGTAADGSITLPSIAVTATASIDLRGNASIDLPLLVVESRVTGSIEVVSQVDPEESTSFAIALNVTNAAVSEYLNYKFNSFTYFNGEYLGVNENGLFSLTGDDDAGVDIPAKIRTGLDSLGSNNLKRVWGVYLSHNAEGISIKTTTESGDFDTLAGPKNRTTVSVQKFKSQRTKRGNYWGVEINNVAGSDFTIEALEVVVEQLGRRAV